MQYVRQTYRFLKITLTENYRHIKFLAKFIIFLLEILNTLINLLVMFLFNLWNK